MKSNLILLCILFADVNSELHKLDYSENYKRLKHCGKNHSKLVLPGYSYLTEGADINDISGGALISPRHILFFTNTLIEGSKRFGLSDKITVPDNCKNNKTTPVSAPDDVMNKVMVFNPGGKNIDIPADGKFFCGVCEHKHGFFILQLPSDSEDFSEHTTCIAQEHFYYDFKPVQAFVYTKSGVQSNSFKATEGVLETCDDDNKDKLCWTPTDKSFSILKSRHSDDWYSAPIFTLIGGVRSKFVGFAFRTNAHDSDAYDVLSLRNYLDEFCEKLGICETLPITSVISTTTVATTIITTTAPPLPTTTNYVPALLLDEKMRDFEVPYNPKKKKSSNTILLVNIVMLWIVGIELLCVL